MNKILFVFNDKKALVNCEVFAESLMEAQERVCKIMGITQINAPVFFTENYDCPKCSCHATECNL